MVYSYLCAPKIRSRVFCGPSFRHVYFILSLLPSLSIFIFFPFECFTSLPLCYIASKTKNFYLRLFLFFFSMKILISAFR